MALPNERSSERPQKHSAAEPQPKGTGRQRRRQGERRGLLFGHAVAYADAFADGESSSLRLPITPGKCEAMAPFLPHDWAVWEKASKRDKIPSVGRQVRAVSERPDVVAEFIEDLVGGQRAGDGTHGVQRGADRNVPQ